MRRLLGLVGLLGALLACEGLNRMSTFVGAFKGADAPFYSTMLLASVVAAGVLLVSLFQRIAGWIKWLTFLSVLGAAALLSNAPAFPVVMQSLSGFAATLLGLLFVSSKTPAS
jgi:hypothetical protein